MSHGFNVLTAPEGVDRTSLEALYAVPQQPSGRGWFRANMVSTVDGAATGTGGLSGGINNALDKEVFHLVRGQCDAIVVGAGTARAENYRVAAQPIVVVSRSGVIPDGLTGAPRGSVYLATCASAPGLAKARKELGVEAVWQLGDDAVDLALLPDHLGRNGFHNVLCEGGPHLLRDALAAGIVDELCLTWVPRLLAGPMPRVLTGAPIDLTLKLQMLLERNGTLLGRWWTKGVRGSD
jgi:riboflavin biosynthesis pyrimidine reductase